LNLRPYEAQLEDQKDKKAQKGHLEEGNSQKPINTRKAAKPSKMVMKSKKSSKPTLPLTLSMQALPLR
jgi:hypothetical protein